MNLAIFWVRQGQLSARKRRKMDRYEMKCSNKPHKKWKWVEGVVGSEKEHIKIKYGNNPEPIALVSPDQNNSFTVQFLVSKEEYPRG